MPDWRLKLCIIFVLALVLFHSILTLDDFTQRDFLEHGLIFLITAFLSYLAFRGNLLYKNKVAEILEINSALDKKVRIGVD